MDGPYAAGGIVKGPADTTDSIRMPVPPCHVFTAAQVRDYGKEFLEQLNK